ncbi:MAG: alpha/beta fold hydrolase [Myxococcota bacterium]
MSFEPAPELPPFIAGQLPFRRRVFVPEVGRDRGQRIHFIDEGADNATVVWMQHGNPAWSFLWRKVISELSFDRVRVVAPDLYGFGLSSKHLSTDEHQLERHLDALSALLEALNPARVIWVGQDWGGPLVAGLGARYEKRSAGLVLLNTSILVPNRPLGTAFHRFSRIPLLSDLAFKAAGFPQRLMWSVQGDRRSIRGAVARAYQWPLRRMRDRAGPLALARMVPNSVDHPSVAALQRGEKWATQFLGPVELLWGMGDPILARALRRHERALPRANVTRTQAGHFLQEEVPAPIAEAVERVLTQADL